MSRSRTVEPLTELEGCVLGFIRLCGPLTPYAVRGKLLESPSSHWSGSAGAVYPLVSRLQRRRLLAAERVSGDGRGGRRYSLTDAGQRAFRAWLTTLAADEIANVPPDPLRTRVAFLAAIAPAGAAALVTDALRCARDRLATLESFELELSKTAKGAERLVCRGATLMQQARIQWLEELQQIVGIPQPVDS